MAGEYRSLPFAEAIAFLRAKRNIPTRRWDDVWKDGHDVGFMVAGAAKADLLNDFRQAIDRAIAEGTTLEDFRRDFDDIVRRHGWSYKGGRGWRTRVIYETNLRSAYAAGRYAQLTDPDLLAHRPYWEYRHGGSADPRAEHLEMDGMVLPADDPVWQEIYPPNGWGCNCRVVALSDADLRRLGKAGPDAPPSAELRRRAIDRGWDYAPGASVAERTRREVERKASALPAALGRRLLRDVEQAQATRPNPFEEES